MARYIISSVVLLMAMVGCTPFAYGQDIAAHTTFTGNLVNRYGYASESAPARIYTADLVKKNFLYNDDGSDEAARCIVGGALLSAIGGIMMFAFQHDQSGSGFQAGAGCTVFGGVFVFGGGFAYLVIKISNRRQGFSMIANKNQVGVAYNF